MPTVHREDGFSFGIYVDDHEPSHLHVRYAGAIARISIGDEDRPPRVIDPGRMKTPDLWRALRVVAEHQEHFRAEWRRIHGT